MLLRKTTQVSHKTRTQLDGGTAHSEKKGKKDNHMRQIDPKRIIQGKILKHNNIEVLNASVTVLLLLSNFKFLLVKNSSINVII